MLVAQGLAGIGVMVGVVVTVGVAVLVGVAVFVRVGVNVRVAVEVVLATAITEVLIGFNSSFPGTVFVSIVSDDETNNNITIDNIKNERHCLILFLHRENQKSICNHEIALTI